MNSLTGISEIYGWLRNAHNARSGGTIQHLELPAFSHPNDGEVDAISSKHSMKIIDGGTESGSASLLTKHFYSEAEVVPEELRMTQIQFSK